MFFYDGFGELGLDDGVADDFGYGFCSLGILGGVWVYFAGTALWIRAVMVKMTASGMCFIVVGLFGEFFF